MLALLAVPCDYVAGLKSSTLVHVVAAALMLLLAAVYFFESAKLPRAFTYWHPIAVWLVLCLAESQFRGGPARDPKQATLDCFLLAENAVALLSILTLLVVLLYGRSAKLNSYRIGKPDWIYTALAVAAMAASANSILNILFSDPLADVVAFHPYRFGLSCVIPRYYTFVLVIQLANSAYRGLLRQRPNAARVVLPPFNSTNRHIPDPASTAR